MKQWRRTILALLALVTVACGSEARGGGAASGAPPARQIVVALDLSGSQSAARRAAARQTLELVIDNLQFGDRLVLLQVHQRAAAEEGAQRWVATAPTPSRERVTTLDRERLDAVKQAARSVAATMFARDSAGLLPTTDLFATMHIAAEYVRDAGPRATTLVLLSDMQQSAHGVEMSRAAPPLQWIEAQRASGVLPRLERTCVSVVGADATTATGVAVREFWKRYFTAAGGTLHDSNYRLITTDAPVPRCGVS